MESKLKNIPGAEVLERRSFLKILFGFSIFSTLASVFVPIIGYLIPPPPGKTKGGGRILVGTVHDIPVGQGEVFPLGNKPVIVTNTTQGGVKAFSAICTHLGCICTWDQDRQIILCPCHDGLFNPVTGAVVGGPPPSPLEPVSVSVEGDDIYIGEL